MYTSMWYVRAESTPRYGFWYCGLGAGQLVGGLISFAAQQAPVNMSFGGWRIMFVVIGVVNILVSLLVIFFLPNTPDDAKFLNDSEKRRIAQRLTDDQAGVGVKVFQLRSVLEAFGDLQTWLLVLLTILITFPSSVITTFSAILIKDFGYTSEESALLNMPSGVVSIVATMVSTYAISKGFSRWLAIDLLLLPTLLGSCLMSFLPAGNQGGSLAGIYLVNTVCIWLIQASPRLIQIDCRSSGLDFCLDRCKFQGIHNEGIPPHPHHPMQFRTDYYRFLVRPSYLLHSALRTLSDLKPSRQRMLLGKP
jgi:sugar phosphate permease